jgi:hypothetical protein
VRRVLVAVLAALLLLGATGSRREITPEMVQVEIDRVRLVYPQLPPVQFHVFRSSAIYVATGDWIIIRDNPAEYGWDWRDALHHELGHLVHAKLEIDWTAYWRLRTVEKLPYSAPFYEVFAEDFRRCLGLDGAPHYYKWLVGEPGREVCELIRSARPHVQSHP